MELLTYYRRESLSFIIFEAKRYMMMDKSYRSANARRLQREALHNAEQQVQGFHKQRADALSQCMTQRVPMVREETENRDSMLHTLRRGVVEISSWSARISRTDTKRRQRHSVLSDNASRVIRNALDEFVDELEGEARRALFVYEEKTRLMVWRVQTHDQYLIDCVFAERRLVRAEEKIRHSMLSFSRSVHSFMSGLYSPDRELQTWRDKLYLDSGGDISGTF